MIYALIALCIVGIAVVSVLFYRRHQNKIEATVQGIEEKAGQIGKAVNEFKDKVK